MVLFFRLEDITLGPAARISGHETYLKAVYNPPDGALPHRIIYKKNKHNRPEFSRFELMFSQLARLFLKPGLTAGINLGIDANQNPHGLAVEHLGYPIARKEHVAHHFYEFNNPNSGLACQAVEVNEPSQIPIYFLDRLPQGIYARLVEAEQQGILSIDYESLASIFTTSYTLEEDDLHRGNYGFYLVERDGKPQAVFFKIDHDLMFVDSIMGAFTPRPFHWFHGPHAFDITAADINSLVYLKNSANSYWPSKFGYLANPFNNKEYHNHADIEAFLHLGSHPEFIRAKWNSFCKQILIPNPQIESLFQECSDMEQAVERAQVALMTQMTIRRVARLRAVLFTIPEFREFLGQLDVEQAKTLFNEIIPANDAAQLPIADTLKAYQNFCHDVDPEDTPLHIAIRLGEYRYDETLGMFHQFINVKNKAGKTPVDLALERIQAGEMESPVVQGNARLIIQHLLSNGAIRTANYIGSGLGPSIETYKFKNPYLERLSAGMDYPAFKKILRDIGEAHQFDLKFKKKLALECAKAFIHLNEGRADLVAKLVQFRNDINGSSSKEEAAGVQYIRQLRSSFWIIRQLRGLYGWTSTQWQISTLINQALERNSPKAPGCFSFFSCAREGEEEYIQANQGSYILEI